MENKIKKYYRLDLVLIILAMALLWLVLGYVMLEIGKLPLDEIVIGFIWIMGALIGIFATAIPKSFAVLHPKYNTPYRAILFLLPISLAFGLTGLLDQIITFSILSALLVYILTAYMMVKFRKMYPLGSIERGYQAKWHPVPAIIVFALSGATLFGMYFGYWINLLAGFLFYLLASVWFVLYRSKDLDYNTFVSKGIAQWPRPKGY